MCRSAATSGKMTKNSIGKGWMLFGGLLVLGAAYLLVREMPSIRREMNLMRM